ncbi:MULTISPECIES: hypothetical protein [Alcanivorax]|uniref:hypothetical protein n=1 Tax=Alcanivorax TaxID=59753 RepID=UPI0025BA9099|nr:MULTISPECIES: hypothetical protein [Alcanivorax]
MGETLRPYVVGGYSRVRGEVSASGSVVGVNDSFSETETFEDESWGPGWISI